MSFLSKQLQLALWASGPLGLWAGHCTGLLALHRVNGSLGGGGSSTRLSSGSRAKKIPWGSRRRDVWLAAGREVKPDCSLVTKGHLQLHGFIPVFQELESSPDPTMANFAKTSRVVLQRLSVKRR